MTSYRKSKIECCIVHDPIGMFWVNVYEDNEPMISSLEMKMFSSLEELEIN